MINNFSYPDALIEALERSLSPERLQSYLTATGGNKTEALRLYLWNTEISAELYKPLQGLEITLRNAFHRELSLVYGSDWYDNLRHVLTFLSQKNIDKAKDDITKRGKTPTPPRVVAELSFGFWVSLLGFGRKGPDNYEMQLWRPAIYKAFPNRPAKGFNRKVANREISSIKELRNRIAHHEPIIHRYNILAEYYKILEAISWLCRDTALWLSSHSRLTEVLAKKP